MLKNRGVVPGPVTLLLLLLLFLILFFSFRCVGGAVAVEVLATF